MILDGLAIGLLNTAPMIGDAQAARRYRDLTLAWLRYGYHGNIIERNSVDEILAEAVGGDDQYCLILACGCIVSERWRIDTSSGQDFFADLAAWIEEHRFLVAGTLDETPGRWYGLDSRCLLIDLDVLQQLDLPKFDVTERGLAEEFPRVVERRDGNRLVELLPANGTVCSSTGGPGANLLRAGLQAGYSAFDLSEPLRSCLLDLQPTSPSARRAMSAFLGDGIADYQQQGASEALTADQKNLLDAIADQANKARRGVFLWNIESYDDIEHPSDDFQSPVTHLYSVAAGFKACRILQTHGANRNTRVVYFDYSERALEIRKFLVERWDGHDFPRFVRVLFETFPHPETFYQLWDGVTPHNVEWGDVQRLWQQELTRWGGEEPFKSFWQTYRHLPHQFVSCNLLADPAPLLDQMVHEPNSVIWWSNAFFTMYGNWFYSSVDRQRAYDQFVSQMAHRNPSLHLYGSDSNNTNVNSIQAAKYWEQYRRSGVSDTHPCRLFRTAIRM